MSYILVEFFNPDIFVCPLCQHKKKRFSNLKNLNIHLKRKHATKYRIVVVNGAALPESRLKSGKLRPKLSKYPAKKR